MNLSSPAAVSDLLRRHHFLPARKFGQNFLVDANVLGKIVAAGDLRLGDSVIEVGTGLGVLTRALAEQVGASGKIVTIERDPKLTAVHEETLPNDQYPQIVHVSGDALEIDLQQLIADNLPNPVRGIAVVANIPYNITSPLIARFLEHPEPLRVIVLLVQKEVGDRLNAKAGQSDYGSFTIFVRYHAEIEIVSHVSPRVFFPPPKVTSSIIKLTPRQSPPVDVTDKERLFAIVRASFQQRRKTILNALSSDALGWSKEQALAVLNSAGIDPQRRGETLSLEEFATLERASWNETAIKSV